MVVLSMEAYEELQIESEIYTKLKEAERVAEETDVRYSAEEVHDAMKDAINGK